MKKKLTIAVFGILLVSGAAAGQEYGQWSWEASLGAGYRGYESEIDGRPVTDYEQRDLRLFAGIHGFIVHPAVAAFSAAIETGVGDRPASESDELGFRTTLSLFPSGTVPIQLRASRHRYDYTFDRDAFFGAIPERGTSFGGSVRVRGGALRGLEASFDRTEIDVLGSPDRERASREALSWSRGSGRLQQHYAVERQGRSYANSDYEIDDLLARAEEQWNAGRWRLNTFATLLRRNGSTPAAEDLSIARLTSSATTDGGDAPSWSFFSESEYSDLSAESLMAHRLEARHLRPRRNGFQWSGTVSWTLQERGDLRLDAPAAAVALNWIGRTGPVDLSAIVSGGVTRLSASGAEAPDATSVSWSGAIRADHASGERLTESFEVSIAENRLRSSFLVDSQPGFGAIGAPGTEDLLDARLTVTRAITAGSLSVFTDWSRRESDLALGADSFETTSWLHTLFLSWRRLSLNATAGETEVISDARQTIDFASGGASFSPFPFLWLSGSYRQDLRSARFEPRIDGERIELGASVRFGEVWLNPLAFRTEERFEGGGHRIYSGFSISLSRSMGGYLPIVTAPRRKGTIQ